MQEVLNINDKNKPQAVLFDWDNTLVDSVRPVAVALNYTFKKMGFPEESMSDFKKRAPNSLRDSFSGFFGKSWKKAEVHFYDIFKKIHLEDLKPFVGSEKLLKFLRRKKIHIGIVSNKDGLYLRKEINFLGWSSYFSSIIGSGDVEKDKPSSLPVYAALESINITPSKKVWFIGDSHIDIECASSSGCLPIVMDKDSIFSNNVIKFKCFNSLMKVLAA